VARIVLVADDSPTIQKKAVGILKGGGFEVETVSNGVAAIRRLAVLQPLVILADVSMPGRDGYEVCDFVKKSADHALVPVLLVASEMEPYDDARGAEVRADGIIKKPFEPQELLSLVVKFAAQFEASAAAKAAPAAPPVAPEAAPEFAAFNKGPDEASTVVQHAAPDFSASSQGIAFAVPTAEEPPGYFPEPPSAEMEMPAASPQAEEIVWEPAPVPEFVETPSAPEPAVAPAAEIPMVVEEQPAMVAPPPSPSPWRAPSYLEGLEAAAPEPVFIEEQAPQAFEPPSAPAEVRTMIFRAPLEIADPVWKDETVPAPPAPEPAMAAELEPQLEAEVPVVPPEVPVEQHIEPPHSIPPVAATSLDSFSLDDATAGQVRFASEESEAAALEVAPLAPVLEVDASEAIIPEPVAEAAPTEIASPGLVPELIHEESAPPAFAAEGSQAEPLAVTAPPAEVAPPLPVVDWGLVYTVVHKVVMRMSPPALPAEVVEELVSRLANELFIELSSESAQPHA
jgi:CheY-like chemotaxis protein